MQAISNARNKSAQRKNSRNKFTMFSAICGSEFSSSNAMTAGSASVWWLDIKTML